MSVSDSGHCLAGLVTVWLYFADIISDIEVHTLGSLHPMAPLMSPDGLPNGPQMSPNEPYQ